MKKSPEKSKTEGDPGWTKLEAASEVVRKAIESDLMEQFPEGSSFDSKLKALALSGDKEARSVIARIGEAIYAESLRVKLEPTHEGEYLVLDVFSGAYEVDKEHLDAARRMRKKHPDGMLYSIRIGSPTPSQPTHPLASSAGIFQDDPGWEEVMEAIREERMRLDE